MLAALAPSVRPAVRCAAALSPLGAAIQLTLPLAHSTPPGLLHGGAAQAPTPLRRAIHSRHHPPISPHLLAALASPMRSAVIRASSLSRLGAALVLAPPASSMRLAEPRAAFRGCCRGTALLLAALAPAVRLAVRRAACLCWLGAALVLTAPASPVRNAVGCAACNSSLETAFVLAPLAASVCLAVIRAA